MSDKLLITINDCINNNKVIIMNDELFEEINDFYSIITYNNYCKLLEENFKSGIKSDYIILNNEQFNKTLQLINIDSLNTYNIGTINNKHIFINPLCLKKSFKLIPKYNIYIDKYK